MKRSQSSAFRNITRTYWRDGRTAFQFSHTTKALYVNQGFDECQVNTEYHNYHAVQTPSKTMPKTTLDTLVHIFFAILIIMKITIENITSDQKGSSYKFLLAPFNNSNNLLEVTEKLDIK